MANDLTGNPLYIDTAGATILWPTPLRIKEVVWSQQVTVGDQLLIEDSLGRIIVSSKADAPDDKQRFGIDGWVKGLKVPTLASGVVMVFLK